MVKYKSEQKEQKEETVQIRIECTKELRTLLKHKALNEQKTLKELITQILQKEVKE